MSNFKATLKVWLMKGPPKEKTLLKVGEQLNLTQYTCSDIAMIITVAQLGGSGKAAGKAKVTNLTGGGRIFELFPPAMTTKKQLGSKEACDCWTYDPTHPDMKKHSWGPLYVCWTDCV
ncbi:hypothetical protein BH10PSE19_BH10PSE19_16780 [soil metagenome]